MIRRTCRGKQSADFGEADGYYVDTVSINCNKMICVSDNNGFKTGGNKSHCAAVLKDSNSRGQIFATFV